MNLSDVRRVKSKTALCCHCEELMAMYMVPAEVKPGVMEEVPLCSECASTQMRSIATLRYLDKFKLKAEIREQYKIIKEMGYSRFLTPEMKERFQQCKTITQIQNLARSIKMMDDYDEKEAMRMLEAK